MARIARYIVIGVVIALIGLLALFIITNNVQGKPCPTGGCATVLVSGGVSLQGKVAGNPSEVIFKASNGQNYTASSVGSGAQGNLIYGPIKLPNYENYNVTIKSGFGGSCSAGSLDLNSKVQGIGWNANC